MAAGEPDPHFTAGDQGQTGKGFAQGHRVRAGCPGVGSQAWIPPHSSENGSSLIPSPLGTGQNQLSGTGLQKVSMGSRAAAPRLLLFHPVNRDFTSSLPSWMWSWTEARSPESLRGASPTPISWARTENKWWATGGVEKDQALSVCRPVLRLHTCWLAAPVTSALCPHL